MKPVFCPYCGYNKVALLQTKVGIETGIMVTEYACRDRECHKSFWIIQGEETK